jgi:hypothetical protein
MFHLLPTPQGSFYIFNDIFRLNYAWKKSPTFLVAKQNKAKQSKAS